MGSNEWLWLENRIIAEGVKQTVQEIRTERERIAEMEQLFEQLSEKVEDIRQELRELEQRVNVLDSSTH